MRRCLTAEIKRVATRQSARCARLSLSPRTLIVGSRSIGSQGSLWTLWTGREIHDYDASKESKTRATLLAPLWGCRVSLVGNNETRCRSAGSILVSR